MRVSLHIIAFLLCLASCARQERAVVYVAGNPVPFVEMDWERLPDIISPARATVWHGPVRS